MTPHSPRWVKACVYTAAIVAGVVSGLAAVGERKARDLFDRYLKA